VEIDKGVALPAPGGLVQLLEVVGVCGAGHAVTLSLQACARLRFSVRLLGKLD
jgi:hypothetical protein